MPKLYKDLKPNLRQNCSPNSLWLIPVSCFVLYVLCPFNYLSIYICIFVYTFGFALLFMLLYLMFIYINLMFFILLQFALPFIFVKHIELPFCVWNGLYKINLTWPIGSLQIFILFNKKICFISPIREHKKLSATFTPIKKYFQPHFALQQPPHVLVVRVRVRVS